MRILITSECLRFGGAQIFALRLAKYLSVNHEVVVYYHFKDYINRKMVNAEFQEVKTICPNIPFVLDFLIRKIDRVCYYLKFDFSIRDKMVVFDIRNFLKKNSFDAVHSHMFKSNYLFALGMHDSKTPFIVTTHGCYENFFNSHLTGKGEKLLNYPKKLMTTLTRVDGLAYLTEKNLSIIEDFVPSYTSSTLVKKIYNGYIEKVPDSQFDGKKELKIDEGAFVYGMVARGIEEKGWKQAIESFEMLNGNSHLILVGDSAYLQNLKKGNKNDRIHFIGFSEKPVNWIKAFDVALLPSYFPAESLPNSVVECLSLGKPIIASDIGEIKEMINSERGSCGFVLPFKDGKVDTFIMRDKMKEYQLSDKVYHLHSSNAKECFDEFDMKTCANNYLTLYKKAIEIKNDTSSNS